MRTALVIVAVALSGCATDVILSSDFKPTQGGFEFQSSTTRFTQHDDPVAEARRIARLEEILRTSSICTEGYKITNRRVVHVAGLVFEVFYDGRCL